MRTSANDRPIGIFDSGLGGLSVFRLLPSLLPAERFVYVADSGRAPYGPRPQAEIVMFSEQIVEYLVDVEKCKAIVIACNTATAAAAKVLRKRYPTVPIVGMEPAVKSAAQATLSGKVGVMATAGTFESEKYADLMSKYGNNIEVFEDPCLGLVSLIEEGDLFSSRLSAKLNTIVGSMLGQGVDTIVLGCTHFPLVHDQISAKAGSNVKLIDPAPAVARQLLRVLDEEGLLADANDPVLLHRKHLAMTSGKTECMLRVLEGVLGKALRQDLIVANRSFD